jgi:hypothetical protein
MAIYISGMGFILHIIRTYSSKLYQNFMDLRNTPLPKVRTRVFYVPQMFSATCFGLCIKSHHQADNVPKKLICTTPYVNLNLKGRKNI